MKLSEGIRLGSAGKGQITNMYYTSDKRNVCAVGALMLTSAGVENILEIFPNLPGFVNEIRDRNDRGETFDQIINWLESIGQ